jgi:glycosyltransferase-like protein
MRLPMLEIPATTHRPCRIALLTYATKPRGSVIHTLELAEALHCLGHAVCIYALDKDGQGFDRPLNCAVRLVPAAAGPSDIEGLIRQRIQEFVDYFRSMELGYDYYHAQDCISANALAILRQERRIPHFIRTIHHIEAYRSPYLQACQERSIRAADLCLCVSQVWQTEIRNQYGIHAPQVLNGVNRQRFSPQPTATDPAVHHRLELRGRPLFLTLGGIEPRKNSINLLQAFARLLPDYPDAQLVIAGGATLFDYHAYRDEFFTWVGRLNVARSLQLPGVIADADLPALYRRADAFVFPSIQEGWGLVLLEAIAARLPILTSQQAPFTEFLDNRQACFVDPQDPAAIAVGMRAIINPAIAPNLIHHSQSVLAQYTWEKSAHLHLHFYQQIKNQTINPASSL